MVLSGVTAAKEESGKNITNRNVNLRREILTNYDMLMIDLRLTTFYDTLNFYRYKAIMSSIVSSKNSSLKKIL